MDISDSDSSWLDIFLGYSNHTGITLKKAMYSLKIDSIIARVYSISINPWSEWKNFHTADQKNSYPEDKVSKNLITISSLIRPSVLKSKGRQNIPSWWNDTTHQSGVVESFAEFAQDTTAHGVKFFFQGKKLSRACFFIVWLAAVIYTCWTCYAGIVDYRSHPTGTKFEVRIIDIVQISYSTSKIKVSMIFTFNIIILVYSIYWYIQYYYIGMGSANAMWCYSRIPQIRRPEDVEAIPFPTISLCNINKIRKDYLDQNEKLKWVSDADFWIYVLTIPRSHTFRMNLATYAEVPTIMFVKLCPFQSPPENFDEYYFALAAVHDWTPLVVFNHHITEVH